MRYSISLSFKYLLIKIGKSKFSVGKNETLNPFGILSTPQKFWRQERSGYLFHALHGIILFRFLYF